jgi:hypothetical protein
VTDRYIPLVTATYGTRVARAARTTMLPRGCNGSQLAQRVRPVLGNHRLVGKNPEGSRQPGRGKDSKEAAQRRMSVWRLLRGSYPEPNGG